MWNYMKMEYRWVLSGPTKRLFFLGKKFSCVVPTLKIDAQSKAFDITQSVETDISLTGYKLSYTVVLASLRGHMIS